MLTTAKKYGLLTLIAVVIAWLLYVAVGSTSFQICIADKGDKQPKQSAEKNSPEVLGLLIASARVKTDCVFVVLDENRDAITAIATAFIAIFTFTLWRSSDQLFNVTKESTDAATMSAKAAKTSARVAENSLVVASRPFITIDPITLCGANEPHIYFGLRNSRGIAIIDRVDVTAHTIREGVGLAKTFPHIAVTINSEIETGQELGGYHITLDYLGVTDPLQRIKSGEIMLKIVFQIISKDVFGKDYRPTISFDFDHGREVFVPSKLLKPENKQQNT
jgi:hypothetical protein